MKTNGTSEQIGRIRVLLLLAIVLPFALPESNQAEDEPGNTKNSRLTLIKTTRAENGEHILTVRSPWQRTDTTLHVMVPDKTDSVQKLRVLYVLPVEAGTGRRWGDALGEIRIHDLHNKHQLICVYPTFSDLPWFADHPTDQASQQETYLVKGVVPLIDEQFPTTAKPECRLLVGFSKSGWGAFTLLLRNSAVFGKAAGWDAPFMMEKSGNYGSGPIFGTQENFADRYQLTKLIEQHAADFRENPRLIHLGNGNFKNHQTQFETLLNEHDVSHIYHHGPKRTHTWSGGWLSKAVELLATE